MKKTHAWHSTTFGRIALFLGSVRLAVPVLGLVAVAMAWGTYLESTQSAKVSKALVYGSWWFIGIMALVCVSLIFAVVTRYPWKRRHIGFITVHAGLVAMILGGFQSLFGRVEGRLALQEGTSGNAIEMDEERLEFLEHSGAQLRTIAGAAVPLEPGSLTLAGVKVRIAERWSNIATEEYVADGGPEPFRAVEIATAPGATTGSWVGEEAKSGGVTTLDGGLRVRVLPDGAAWDPPAKAEPVEAGYAFVMGEQRYPLAEEGREAFPGWKIVSVRRFTKALVSGGGLSEGDSDRDNPAVEVVIDNGQGTKERHTAFLNFPDMVMGKSLEGTARSGARLAATPGTGSMETLVIYGPVSAPALGYIAADGAARRLEQTGPLPLTVDVGTRKVTLLRQFTRAHAGSRFVKAPPASEYRPALLLSLDGAEPVVAAWKDNTHVQAGGRTLLVRYGPRTVELPFTVRLTDFRKTDYPGTEMAMAYESHVAVSTAGGPEVPHHISMNNPYAGSGWKVYQSGFVGENLSIFSVMKDPGLPLTYIGSVVLCVGIMITFYSRSMSWGHPGIPVAFANKEPVNAPPAAPPARPGSVAEPVHSGV